MNQLTLSFLGAFEAVLDDQPLSNFRSAKVQGLLIYLALTRQQAHARDVLATLFWPDEPERLPITTCASRSIGCASCWARQAGARGTAATGARRTVFAGHAHDGAV